MPSRIDSLLNPSIGIADLLPMPDAAALPEARDLGTNLLQESGLENLFRTANSRSAIGDGSLVSPEIFEADLHALLEKLRKSENPKIQALVREEIEPLLQNGLLLTAYRNLMLGG